MYKETSRQGVQGVQDKCLLASYFHKQGVSTALLRTMIRKNMPDYLDSSGILLIFAPNLKNYKIMTTLTDQQIEQKKQLLAEKMKEAKVIYDELMEAGAVPMDDDELDQVAGGRPDPSLYEPYDWK